MRDDTVLLLPPPPPSASQAAAGRPSFFAAGEKPKPPAPCPAAVPTTGQRPPLFGPVGIALRSLERNQNACSLERNQNTCSSERNQNTGPPARLPETRQGQWLGCLDRRTNIVSTYLAWPKEGLPPTGQDELALMAWACQQGHEAMGVASRILSLPISWEHLATPEARLAFEAEWSMHARGLHGRLRFCLRNLPDGCSGAQCRAASILLRGWGRAPILLTPPSLRVLRLLTGQGFYAVALDYARWQARLGSEVLAQRLPVFIAHAHECQLKVMVINPFNTIDPQSARLADYTVAHQTAAL